MLYQSLSVFCCMKISTGHVHCRRITTEQDSESVSLLFPVKSLVTFTIICLDDTCWITRRLFARQCKKYFQKKFVNLNQNGINLSLCISKCFCCSFSIVCFQWSAAFRVIFDWIFVTFFDICRQNEGKNCSCCFLYFFFHSLSFTSAPLDCRIF